jgi:hypothetical protein
MPRIFTPRPAPPPDADPLGLKPKQVPLENLSLSRTLEAAPVVSLQITRREPFKYRFHGKRPLPIAAERATGDEGETYVEGLPAANFWGNSLPFPPAIDFTDGTIRAF